jgi:hypothetical protein
MKRVASILPVLLAMSVLVSVRAAYTYFFTENLASPNWSNWTKSGYLSVGSSGGYSDVGGNGVMLHNTYGPGEIRMTIRRAEWGWEAFRTYWNAQDPVGQQPEYYSVEVSTWNGQATVTINPAHID